MKTAEVITIRAGVTANTTRHSVARDGVEVFLSPQLFQIFMRVGTARFGVTPAQLFEVIYADAIDGGPLTGRKAMHVQRVNLNKKLVAIGLRITSAGSSYRDRTYELTLWFKPPIRERNAWPAVEDGQMRLSDFGIFDPPTEEPAAD